MSNKSWFTRLLARKWIQPKTFFDGWFTLADRVRKGFERLIQFNVLPVKDFPSKPRWAFVPQLEGLETRLVMTTVSFQVGNQQVNYDASAFVNVVLSGSHANTITVQYTTNDDSATVANGDYTWTAGTLTFLPGQTSKTISGEAISDYRHSVTLDFYFSLSNPTGATLGATTTDYLTITNLPIYVVDANTNEVLPLSDGNTGLNISSFANWNMSLLAEDRALTISSYSWDFTNAPDAAGITGNSTENVQFNWDSFSTGTRYDDVVLRETATTEVITESYEFQLSGTSSPAYVSNANQPTSAGTWSATPVIAPDKLIAQDLIPAGPYTSVGLVDGSVHTAFSLPSYNPDAAPLSVAYNSAVADPEPIFMLPYNLGASLPSSLTAKLTITSYPSNSTVFTGSVMSYTLLQYNPNDTIEFELQATGMGGDATGRYGYNIAVTASGGTPVNYSGYFNFINSSTTPDSTTTNPFGAGWSSSGVEHLYKVTGGSYPGVIIQNPDGTSLWFAGTSSFTPPAGDFSTLSLSGGVYTRTLPDGTQINFTSSSYDYDQSSIVDRNGHTTLYGYDGSNELTAVTDINGQTSTISYTSGLATTLTDPASRSATFSYSSGDLTAIVDTAGHTWTYAYSSNELTTLEDPRSTGSNYSTGFTYDHGEVVAVYQPDGSALYVTPEQWAYLPNYSTGIYPGLAADVFGSYQDGNGDLWVEYTCPSGQHRGISGWGSRCVAGKRWQFGNVGKCFRK